MVTVLDCTWRKVCTCAAPALPPGTVNGGDNGGMSLGCFGGVDTIKITFVARLNSQNHAHTQLVVSYITSQSH